MIRILFIHALIFTALSLHAKDWSSEHNELRTILSEISSFTATFNQRITNEIGEQLQVTSGEISIGKPNKMRWEVMSPDENLSIADGISVYVVDPFVEQVTILDQQKIIQNNPLVLLMNDDEENWQQVTVTKEGNSFYVKSNVSDVNITEMVMRFDDQRNLVSVTSLDIQGQNNHLEFSNVVINPMLQADLFLANIPENYAVDDQR